jgi:hypothetical protein
MPNFNEQAWLEGFISEAAAMGLDKQAAQELLKTAVRRELMESNPAFATGFQQEMKKLAAMGGAATAKLLAALGLGGAATLGGKELFDRFRTHIDRSPEQQQLVNMMRGGLWSGNPEDLAANMNFMVGQQMANRATRRGGNYFDPSYNPQQWMNIQRPAYPGFQLGW